MYLIVKHAGTPIFALREAKLTDLEAHLRNGYPELVEDYKDGLVTAEETALPPTFGAVPVTDKEIVARLLRGRPFLEYLFRLENRINALEAKPVNTAEQFRAAVKARLGI